MNYFCGRAKSALTFQADEEIPARYYALVNDDGLDDYDDRRSCIEIQISKKISLKDALLTIVLPSTLLDDERVSVAIYQEWGTFPITYAIVHGTAPSQYTAVIRQRLLDFLSDTGYLK